MKYEQESSGMTAIVERVGKRTRVMVEHPYGMTGFTSHRNHLAAWRYLWDSYGVGWREVEMDGRDRMIADGWRIHERLNSRERS